MLQPLIGLKLDGATLAEVDELGGLGTPAWGPASLLRDLELRLGLQVASAPQAVRVHQWSARLASLLDTNPFYGRSYRADPIGTAEMLLAWRDGLVDSGWAGTTIPGGGERLAAFAALEALRQPTLSIGPADRLAAVEVELAIRKDSPYAALTCADDPSLWPHRWQRVFGLLAERGARMANFQLEDGSISTATDLGRLQLLIRQSATAPEPVDLRGDGTLVILRAATTQSAADVVAAYVCGTDRARTAIIRPGPATLLDHSLDACGAGMLGCRGSSRWRAPLQLLPLALEMVFAPADPRRILELLGLAISPFAPVTRRMMSRALGDSPGIGDVRWQDGKRRLYERLAATGEPAAIAHAAEQVTLVETWLEPVRHSARDGAPKAIVAGVTTRVHDWMCCQTDDDLTMRVAVDQCRQVIEILESDAREALDLLSVRQLLDAVLAPGADAELTVEQVGRAHHVDHPGALLRRCDLVIWWHFVAATARPPHRARWRKPELEALAACAVVPTAPTTLLAEESRQWRSAVLAARHRLLLVVPDADRGDSMTPHPLWDEIVGRLRLDESRIARITVTVAERLSRPHADLAVEELAPLALPPARPSWRVPVGRIAAAARLTPASVQALLECPLRWVFAHAAALDSGSVPSLPDGALLNGILGHRVVQALVEIGGLASAPDTLARVIDGLLPGVAASLLQPGFASELHQLRHQLATTIEALADVLHRGALTVAATEEEVAASWLGAELVGRLDLRLHDRAGRELILDLKWGHGTYRELLHRGRAVQLAAYAQARRLQTGAAALPAAGYFSLAQGRLLTPDAEAFGAVDQVEGPALDQTVEHIAATVPLVQRALADGQVWVTGVRQSRPLLETLGVPAATRSGHYDPAPGDGCAYCRFSVLCGRAWESPA